MARAQTVVGSALLLLAGVLSFSACSTASDDAAKGDCGNALKDGDEVGVDCGGSCAKLCTGAGCTVGDECASNKCETGACGAKAGKPCGVGTAVPICDNGQPCELDKDCKSLTCVGATCGVTADSPPGPADGKKNLDETDVDCGGAGAPKCADGKACAADTDCATGYCPADKKLCIAPTYDDTVKNGTETDVDCGGTTTTAGFKKCAADKVCAEDTDCIGACNYEKKCVDVPSCKPHNGGDTCGAGELANGTDKRESCCKTLPVPGFNDPAKPGKAVFLDKFEITAGRIRAFVEDVTAKSAGKPNIKAWVAANTPPIWSASWNLFLPTQNEGDAIVVPRNPSNNTEAPPWNRDAGLFYQFNGQLFIYVHGHNTNNAANAFGLATFWLPDDVQAKNNGLPRREAFDGNGTKFAAKDWLDVKSATAIPNAIFAAFCHWDGGQLATDEVLDFVTNSPASLGNAAGCGAGPAGTGGRCPPIADINAISDSGQGTGLPYFFPYYGDPQPTTEASAKIAAPGRMVKDVVRITAGAEPWMDLHGNVEESVLDVTGATFTGKFGLKYRGIGFNSARANAGGSNTDKITYPEYKAGYTGARCMRFK